MLHSLTLLISLANRGWRIQKSMEQGGGADVQVQGPAGFQDCGKGLWAETDCKGVRRKPPQVLDHAGQIGRGISEPGSRRYLRTREGLTMDYLSTRQVARILGVSASLLTKAVGAGRVDPPPKSPSGNYLWTLSDLERVSQVLVRKPSSSQKRSPNTIATGADAVGRANMRSKHRGADRLARLKTVRKKTWLILVCLRDWVWKLSGGAMKAFFDALLDHYGGR